MFVKRLQKDVFDIFIGNTWDQWTRVKREKGEYQVIAGANLNKTTLNYLKGRLANW